MKKSFWVILLTAMAIFSTMTLPAMAEINRFRILDQYDFEKSMKGDVILHFGGIVDASINVEPIRLLVDGDTKDVVVVRGEWENGWEKKYNCRMSVLFLAKQWEKLLSLHSYAKSGGRYGHVPVTFQVGTGKEQIDYVIDLEYYFEGTKK